MKRLVIAAVLVFVAAGVSSADYILIRIDLNKLQFMPDLKDLPGIGGQPGQPGQVPGGQPPLGQPPLGQPPLGQPPFGQPPPGQPPMPIDPNNPMPPGPPGMLPDDPNAKWVSTVLEIRNKSKVPFQTPFGMIFTYDHPWSTQNPNFLPISPIFPWVSWPPVESKTPAEEITAEIAKLKVDPKIKDKAEKNRLLENHFHVARLALARGRLNQFQIVMKEAEKLDDKHPIIKNYQRVKKALAVPLKADDPAQVEILQDLVKRDYKQTLSKSGKQPGHYAVYSLAFGDDKAMDVLIERRLKMMEDTLETFYYWFALQEKAIQPAFPKYRLNAIVAGSKEEFKKHHLDWGAPPMVADGFTARRENLVVMSAKVRLNDANYQELDGLITARLQDINQKLEPFKLQISREDLLSGKVHSNKATGQIAIFVAAAQTAIVCAKAMETEAERHTVTSETIRQLLYASEMFPRNVQIPDWMTEGLGALFETPVKSVYPTIGEANWVHAISFKHLRKTKKITDPEDTLRNVVTDYYFQTARQLSREAQDQPGNVEARKAAQEAWEIARSTSWSFTHYLATKGKLDYLAKYGKQLDQLPRDMDLSTDVLQSCFAAGFDMKDSQDPRQVDSLKMKAMAEFWFALADGVNLRPAGVMAHYEKARASQDGPPAGAPTQPNPNPGVNPPTQPNPPPQPPPPSNQKAPPLMIRTTWTGTETNNSPLKFKFGVGIKVTVENKDGTFDGSFTHTFDQVSITFKAGNDTVEYFGKVAGNTLAGRVTKGAEKWDFSVNFTSSDDPGNPAANPNPNPRPGGNPNPGINPKGGFPNPNPGMNPNPGQRPPQFRPPQFRPPQFRPPPRRIP